MSLKNKIGLAFDVSVLVAASTVTAKAAISAFEMFKEKKGLLLISSTLLIVVVGLYASKHSIQNIRNSKDDDSLETKK